MNGISIESKRALVSARSLLLAGVIMAPLFYAAAVSQVFTRPGFDIRYQAISMLSLGRLGWIQIANFIVNGVLALVCAFGVRRALAGEKGGLFGPILIAVFGIGMVIAGIFHPDPALGFPAGAPRGIPATSSTHAAIHNLAFFASFIALVAACFVFVRRFAALAKPGWVIYCMASGVVTPALIIAAAVVPGVVGIITAVAGAVAFGWVSVVAAELRREGHGNVVRSVGKSTENQQFAEIGR